MLNDLRGVRNRKKAAFFLFMCDRYTIAIPKAKKMLSHKELEKTWADALRVHASTPLQGEAGPYMPIGAKSMTLLTSLWKAQEPLDIGPMLAEGKDVRAFGDPHFEHANIIHMCERPFEAVETMDKALWEAIDSAHAEADFVLCVGDWAMKNPITWARKIASMHPGKHVTTVGNHDAKGAKAEQWLKAGARASMAFSVERGLVKSWVDTYEPELSVMLDWDEAPRVINVGVAHWPVPPQRLPGPAWISLHGHVHNRPDRPLRINCSVEAIDFKPKSIQRLINARVIDDLIRRRSGLDLFDESKTPNPGDSSYL